MAPNLDMDEVYILTAKLIYTNILRALNDIHSPAHVLLKAIKPFFAVQFTRRVVREVDGYLLKVLMARLKRSSLSAHWYQMLLKHMSVALTDDSVAIPLVFEEWRCLLVRFQLCDSLPFPDWIPLLNNLVAHEVRSPTDLAALTRLDILTLTIDSPHRELLLKLWQCASHVSAQTGHTADSATLALATNAGALASSFRAAHIEDTGIARSCVAAVSDLGVPSKFESAGPAAKIRLLAASKPDPAALERFLNTGSQLNILRQVQSSLRSVAAGVQCWASFCDLIGVAYFPPTPHSVLRWSSLFHPGKTFGLYVAHLSKACQILGFPLNWITASARGAIKGLINAMDISFKFENYIFKTLFRAIIARESLSSEWGRLFYLAYVFILRLPSEALVAVRAGPTDQLMKASKLAHQSALGLREFPDGNQFLVLKLRTRKHTRGGAILFRPCFCRDDILGCRGLCPVHDFWRAVSASTVAHHPLFPSLINRNVNRVLKGMLTAMGVEDASMYSTHAFRRGAAMELKRSTSSFEEVLKTVGWNSASFRSYLSFAEDEAANVRLILAYDTDESDGEDFPEDFDGSSSSPSSTSEGTSPDIALLGAYSLFTSAH